jgi:hypothetical protein
VVGDEEPEVSTETDRAGVDDAPIVEWQAILRAALSGLVVVLPISVIYAVLERQVDDFDDSAWPFLLFLALLFVFAFAGWYAGLLVPRAPLSNGALAGLGVLVTWLPIRVVIWALRDDSRGLVSGSDPVITIFGVFGLAIAATAFGMLGGRLSLRRGPSE